MNKVSKFLAPVAMAAAVLWAPNASAGSIYFGGYAGTGTYIGSYDAAASDFGQFGNSFTTTNAGFTDTWVFKFSPIGSATTNANFLPVGWIAGFQVDLWNAVASPATVCPTLGAVCTTFALGSHIVTGVPGTASSNIGFTGLSAGWYAITVAGSVGTAPASYTGQLQVSPVPEPASLALVGAALVGLAFSTRKRKSV